MKENMSPQTQHKPKRVSAQQPNMVYNQKTRLMEIMLYPQIIVGWDCRKLWDLRAI